ncbi:MAG: hypothetical protein ABIJ65_11485 [Chloroflexota bacterium]
MIILSASIGQMLSRDWRWSLGFLGTQYLGVFGFVQTIWPINLAIVKLISGLIVCLAFATSQKNTTAFSFSETSWPQGRLFRLLATALILLTTLSISSQTSLWLGISNRVGTWASLLLMGIGLLQLGITTQPMRVIIALLTLISGFEIIYAYVESSALVAAMLVLINLGLSLVGIYMLNTDYLENVD